MLDPNVVTGMETVDRSLFSCLLQKKLSNHIPVVVITDLMCLPKAKSALTFSPFSIPPFNLPFQRHIAMTL
jgi:hypothetical protein